GGGIRACGCSAEPADQGTEERIKGACPREGQAERGVETAEACDESKAHQCGDRNHRKASGDDGLPEDLEDVAMAEPHYQRGNECSDEDSAASGREPVECKDSSLRCGMRNNGGYSEDDTIKAGDG